MGSCILGGGCHSRLLVLGEGGGVNMTRNIFFLLLTYLRSVLIFISEIKMKNCALLSSNLPSVIDRSHLSPSREVAR